MDRELRGRKAAQRPHRKVVGTTVEDSKLLSKVI